MTPAPLPPDQDAKDAAQRAGSPQLFAGLDNGLGIATCWTCGFTWRTGLSGQHSCAVELSRRLTLACGLLESLAEAVPQAGNGVQFIQAGVRICGGRP